MAQKQKGTPAKKKTPAWSRYLNENRHYHHKLKKIAKHLERQPNDKQSESRMQSIKDKGPVKKSKQS